jgi:hypothetical protein
MTPKPPGQERSRRRSRARSGETAALLLLDQLDTLGRPADALRGVRTATDAVARALRESE